LLHANLIIKHTKQTSVYKRKIPWLSNRKVTVQTDWPPRQAKLVPPYADRGYCVVSAADPYDG
jgi:hypothetical protein